MTIRELVYKRVSTDPELNALGITGDTVYANGAPDSPQERFFAVLRWGPDVPALGGARGRLRPHDQEVTFWVYTRDQDYGDVNLVVKRCCELMDGIEAVRTGLGADDGWIIDMRWQGDGDDGYDDVYEANYRSSTYRIIGSGD